MNANMSTNPKTNTNKCASISANPKINVNKCEWKYQCKSQDK